MIQQRKGGTKTIDGINITEVSDGILNLRSSNGDTYDIVSSHYKACLFLKVEMRKKLNCLTPPAIKFLNFQE